MVRTALSLVAILVLTGCGPDCTSTRDKEMYERVFKACMDTSNSLSKTQLCHSYAMDASTTYQCPAKH